MDGNPFTPRWDKLEAIPADIQRKRHPQLVKSICDQWFQCAKRSKSEAVREFYYKEQLIKTATANRHIGTDYAEDITVDAGMDDFPKVTPLTNPGRVQECDRPRKQKAAANNGPENGTQIPLARKRKEPKLVGETEDANGVEMQLEELDAQRKANSPAPKRALRERSDNKPN